MGSLLPTVCALAWQLTHTIWRLSSSKALGLLLLHRCSHNFVGTNQDFPILARRYGARCWHSCCKSCLASILRLVVFLVFLVCLCLVCSWSALESVPAPVQEELPCRSITKAMSTSAMRRRAQASRFW